MNPFRKNVLVLFGAALLIAMSVGSALGAKPTSSDASGPRGQTISDFVHSVLAGDQEVTVDETPTDEAPTDEAPADEGTDCKTDEDASDEDATGEGSTDEDAAADTTPGECATDETSNDTEDTTAADETSNDNANTDANAHGKCVSEIAQGTETGGDNDNHGGAVSLAARETCREEATGAQNSTAADLQAEMTARDTAAAERKAAKDARKADQAAAQDARKADQAAAQDARKADQAAAQDARKAEGGATTRGHSDAAEQSDNDDGGDEGS